MAAETGSWQFLSGLPEQLQGVAVLGITAGLAILYGRRFLAGLNGTMPKEVALADAAIFADMGPIHRLLESVNALTAQQIKTEAAMSRVGASLEDIAENFGDLIEQMKEDREKKAVDEEVERRVNEEVQRKVLTALKATRKRPAPRRTAAPKE